MNKSKRFIKKNYKYLLGILFVFFLYVLFTKTLEKHSQPLILNKEHLYFHDLRKNGNTANKKFFLDDEHAKQHGWDNSLFAGNFVDPNNQVLQNQLIDKPPVMQQHSTYVVPPSSANVVLPSSANVVDVGETINNNVEITSTISDYDILENKRIWAGKLNKAYPSEGIFKYGEILEDFDNLKSTCDSNNKCFGLVGNKNKENIVYKYQTLLHPSATNIITDYKNDKENPSFTANATGTNLYLKI
jgi:hypothetical protein